MIPSMLVSLEFDLIMLWFSKRLINLCNFIWTKQYIYFKIQFIESWLTIQLKNLTILVNLNYLS